MKQDLSLIKIYGIKAGRLQNLTKKPVVQKVVPLRVYHSSCVIVKVKSHLTNNGPTLKKCCSLQFWEHFNKKELSYLDL